MAVITQNAHLRGLLHRFWAVFFEFPSLVLVILGLAVGTIIAVILFVPKKLVVDNLLAGFIFGLFTLYMILLSLHILNYGLSWIPSFLAPIPMPPLSITNPLLGFTAFILILFKGALLERTLLRQKSSTLESFCLMFGFGFGITSFQVMLLSLFHVLYFHLVMISDVLLISSLVIICLLRASFKGFEDIKNETTHAFVRFIRVVKLRFMSGVGRIFNHQNIRIHIWEILILCALGALFVASSYYAIAAIVEWDSLAYIANYAKLIYKNNGILDLHGPSIGLEMSAAYPIGFQSLGVYFYKYVGGVDDFYMRFLSPIFYLLTLLASYLFSTELFSSIKERLLLLFTASSTPLLVYYIAFSGHYLSYLIFLTTAFLYFLMKYLRTREQKFLIIASLFGGFASLVSYLGLLSLIFLGVSITLRKSFLISVKAFLINLVVPLPYLLRNFILLKDPVYPLLSRFLDPLWASREVHFNLQSIYVGLQLGSAFSIIDFLIMRFPGVRPLVVIVILLTPLLLIHLWRTRKLREVSTPEKCLLLFLFISFSCFLAQSTFERYVLPFIAIYACTYVWLIVFAKKFKMMKLASILILIMISSFVITLGAALGGYRTSSANVRVNNIMDYLEYYYPDDASIWKWLNENTGQNEKVASFDIRYYYIIPEVVPLDGQLARPLYRSDITVDEALHHLKSLDIKYIYSTRWSSPMSPVTPPAYYQNIVTRYLGDPSYFPPVYVKGSSAVYHVGALNISELVARYLSQDVIPPLIGYNITLQRLITNNTLPPTIMLYLSIPCDYHNRVKLIIRAKSFPYNVSIELWQGQVDLRTKWWESYSSTTSDPRPAYMGKIDPRLEWVVKGGDYTIVIRLLDEYKAPVLINLEVNLTRLMPED
jgi:hypothetical protein